MQNYTLGSVRLSPDGVGGGLLDEDLSQVDTSFPLLREGVYNLEITSVTEEDNKDKTGTNLVVKVKTTAPATSVKGDQINVGFPLVSRISLTPTEKNSKDDIKRRLAQFAEAVLGTHSGAFGPLDKYVGKVVQAKVVVRVDPKGQFPDANDIKSWVTK